MEKQWQVQRTMIARKDAQLRWDLAYQCLLKWRRGVNASQRQEVGNESRNIRPSVNSNTGRIPNN